VIKRFSPNNLDSFNNKCIYNILMDRNIVLVLLVLGIILVSGCAQKTSNQSLNNTREVSYACEADDDCVITYGSKVNCCPGLCSGSVVNKTEEAAIKVWRIENKCALADLKKCPVADCESGYNKYVPKCIDSKCVLVKSE